MKYPVSGRKGPWVKLDGYQDGKLIDAKYWDGNSQIIDSATGKFKPFITAPITEAKAQVARAVDTPIVYYVSTEQAAIAFRHGRGHP
ncbi:hypothetical protein [Streptomyces nodosus]|uniref:Tox-REase-5 domain-containing protein n=1 Tax=Streptomyces nodosus TaxID=40318 RepID=A0A0B5DIQ9_9ACTN|nr:hypothetical protein [Streptomyces nodosus]AJE43598.1 hypothetical protein SNOD_28935 [Streptomyces nodosus]MBB4795082.1 hypothetical protein [Streptomyces nodosus]QEV42102.1 hypothetical protein CP978_29205 [Streptomyces nodosus]